ncbi:hypothetical protein [Loktanella sp. S4079]|uniref:hypothetical protein n=1 Tax=Loktanella sp. S4079 TaxID=579483 RepID=UPI0006963BC3|nr:hypothetical protein [Loktanella sp. S4079]
MAFRSCCLGRTVFSASQVWASALHSANVQEHILDQQDTTLDRMEFISRLLNLQTFSNIWFWGLMCVLWMLVSYWVLGVPYDMIQRARRLGGQAENELLVLLEIKAGRLARLWSEGGAFFVGIVAFVLTSMAVTGFYYGIEAAQGLFLLLTPLAIVGAMNLRAGIVISQREMSHAERLRRLLNLRIWVQVVGAIAVFVSAAYGMVYNLAMHFHLLSG